MALPKLQPVGSTADLRERIGRLFRTSTKTADSAKQLSLDFLPAPTNERDIETPSRRICTFLDFVSCALPDGDVYLFGGILRDLALLGRKGFASDIDLVVEGDWSHLVPYLCSLNACKNKFGGYRLELDGWPIDIWHARETWAFKRRLVPYTGISSLTETTVLNWDAILMNWRTREFVYRQHYFEQLTGRELDIVLEQNPNPLGMIVRAFRHFSLKDAKRVTPAAARFLANGARTYNFEEIKSAEMKSYGDAVVNPLVHRFFAHMDTSEEADIRQQFGIARSLVVQELALLGQ